MVKKILDKVIICNAFFSTNREYLTKGQIYHYCQIVDSLLPEGYYNNGNNNSFSDFYEEYPFLVKKVGDTMIINCEISLLEKHCRVGIPKVIINVFDRAGVEFNKVEEKNQINYNDANLEDLRRHIEEKNQMILMGKFGEW